MAMGENEEVGCLWFVECELWFVVCGLWFVVCGLFAYLFISYLFIYFLVCDAWFVVCGLLGAVHDARGVIVRWFLGRFTSPDLGIRPTNTPLGNAP